MAETRTDTNFDYDPYDNYYKGGLKETFNNNAKEYFEDLTKKAKTDTEANKETVKKIKKANAELQVLNAKVNKFTFFKNLCIFLAVIGFLAAIVGFFLLIANYSALSEPLNSFLIAGILCLVLGLLVGIGSILVYHKAVKDKLNAHLDKFNTLVAKRNRLVKKAKKQLLPLVNSFGFLDFINNVNNLKANFTLDEKLDPKKMELLKRVYELDENFLNKNECVIECSSGNIEKNPFIRISTGMCTERMQTYTGTRTVTWTETHRDSQGNVYTTYESEVLVATYSAKAPNYTHGPYLIYGNEAAPNLTFFRRPSGLSRFHSSGDVESVADSNYKDIQKLAKKDKSANRIQPLANSKFEGLFNCRQRDNEVEYRLLFTPLAQQNMVEIITSSQPYGDDFTFTKLKKLNIVYTYHSVEVFQFRYDDAKFYDIYDYEELKNKYVTDMCNAFEAFYFDLIPVLAIPLYQMSEPDVYHDYKTRKHVSNYEAEAFANNMDGNLFRDRRTKTEQIIKLKYLYSVDKTDVYQATSSSYDKIKHIEHIPVVCRNGNIYDVPVVWYEYIPYKRTTKVAFGDLNDFDTYEDGELLNEKNILKHEMSRYKNFVSYFLDQDDLTDDKNDIFVKAAKSRYNLIK